MAAVVALRLEVVVEEDFLPLVFPLSLEVISAFPLSSEGVSAFPLSSVFSLF